MKFQGLSQARSNTWVLPAAKVGAGAGEGPSGVAGKWGWAAEGPGGEEGEEEEDEGEEVGQEETEHDGPGPRTAKAGGVPCRGPWGWGGVGSGAMGCVAFMGPVEVDWIWKVLWGNIWEVCIRTPAGTKRCYQGLVSPPINCHHRETP